MMGIDSAILGYIIEELTYSNGDVILEEGAHGDWVCIIMKGHVKVKKKTDKGIITLASLSEGDIIGEMAFLEGGETHRSASIIAASDPVEIGVIDNERLTREYENISPRIKTLIKILMMRRREANERVSMAVGQLRTKEKK
jgi:CRP-like cAMP-binding protein